MCACDIFKAIFLLCYNFFFHCWLHFCGYFCGPDFCLECLSLLSPLGITSLNWFCTKWLLRGLEQPVRDLEKSPHSNLNKNRTIIQGGNHHGFYIIENNLWYTTAGGSLQTMPGKTSEQNKLQWAQCPSEREFRNRVTVIVCQSGHWVPI